jgi:quercetin dioxygenase-like cupin family protein
MTHPNTRLREAPSERFAGSERRIVLADAVATLRAEPRPTVQGHRQVTLLHGQTLRLVLFAFEAGGHLPIYEPPGPVTLQGVSGTLRVRTPLDSYVLDAGQLLLLDAGVSIDVDAVSEADMLLSISMYDEWGRRAPPDNASAQQLEDAVVHPHRARE